MTHIDEGTLQAYLDGELHLENRWRTERHLEECELCRAEIQGLKGRAALFTGAMKRLDSAPRGREHAVGWPRAAWLGEARRMLPRAAVVLLFVGAAASATVPGSPVRRWFGELTSPQEAVETAAPAISAPEAAPPPAPPAEAGVFVEAADGEVEVVLRGARDLRVRTLMVEGTRAGVAAAGPAASSRFLTGAGRIEVLNAASGDLRIEVPRGATVVRVIINGNMVLRKQDADLALSAEVPELESAGIAFSLEQ